MPSKIVYVPHYTVVGSPTISDDYIASSLSGSNYFQSTESIPSTANTWELGIKFHTGTSFSGTAQYFVGQTGATISVGLWEGGPATNFGDGSWFNGAVNIDTTYAANTDYWYKVSFDGTKYSIKRSTDGEDFTEIAYLTNSNHIATTLVNIGYQPGSLFTSIDLKEVYMKVDGVETWRAVTEEVIDVSGSVSISKGYYNNGTYKIITQGTTASLTDLSTNQTVGCKNDLYMTTASGTVAPYITSLEAPTGTFDATVKLDTPVYLDWTKEYIAGGAEIAPEWSFSNGGILTDYTLVGTPTIDSDYIASNFSSRNAVAATVTLDTSKPWELRTKITTGSNVSTRQKFVGGVNGVDCKVPTLEFRSSRVYVCIPNTSGNGWLAEVDTSYVVSSSTSYWFKYGWTGTTYFLQVSTDGTTYSSIYSWNSSTAAYHSDSYKVGFGNDLYMSNDQFPFYGSIDLKLCSFDIEGTLAWSAIFADEKKIVTQKALAYDSVADKTYWYPQTTSVTLTDVKAAQTVNMKNHLYCTNTTGSSIASHTFCEGTPSGVTEYYQQPEYVWLNFSKDTILGVQEEPDEIVLEVSSNNDEVVASQDHYWTYLQGVTYDAQGSTLAISGMSPSALTGHLLVDTSGALSYSEDTDISQSVLLPTKAYTGYDVTFTDNTYTTIQSVDKAGTKCRIYSSNIDAETRSQLFVALPVTEYEEGFEGGSLPYKSVVQSLLELKTPLEYTTTDSFVVTTTPGGFVDYYNPTEDKFYVYETGIYTGFRALSYSGDAYILDSTGA